jgi:flagellar motor switch protein FliG
MPLEPQAEKGFTQAWHDLAESINHMSEDKRKQIQKVLSVFMHDMKHTLGLISNANELIRRDIQKCPQEHKSEDMISIVHTAAQQLDEYFDTIVEACCNKIDIGED